MNLFNIVYFLLSLNRTLGILTPIVRLKDKNKIMDILEDYNLIIKLTFIRQRILI